MKTTKKSGKEVRELLKKTSKKVGKTVKK